MTFPVQLDLWSKSVGQTWTTVLVIIFLSFGLQFFFLSIPLNKLPWDISSGHTLFKTMQQSKKSEKMCLIPGKCIVSAMVPLQMVTKVRGKTIVLHSNVLCAADDSPRPLKLFFDKGCFSQRLLMSSSYPQTDEKNSYLSLKIWNWDVIM